MESQQARFEKRNLCRMSNIKKVQNHEYHVVPEESMEDMSVEKPKQCNDDRN